MMYYSTDGVLRYSCEVYLDMGFRQKWENATNRSKVINLLFQKSYRFNELFEASGFASKSTLNKHLNELLEEGVIEKAFEDNKPIYRFTLDADTITSEVKNIMFDNLINHFNEKIPGLKLLVDAFLLSLARIKIVQKMREVNRTPELTDDEFKALLSTYYKESLADFDPNYNESALMQVFELIDKILDFSIIEEDSK